MVVLLEFVSVIDSIIVFVGFRIENMAQLSTASCLLVLVLSVRLKSFDVLILPLDRFLKALGHMYLVVPVHYCRVATAERPSEFG